MPSDVKQLDAAQPPPEQRFKLGYNRAVELSQQTSPANPCQHCDAFVAAGAFLGAVDAQTPGIAPNADEAWGRWGSEVTRRIGVSEKWSGKQS